MSSSNVIDKRYESKMEHDLTAEYYGHSGFFNFGYWEEDTITQKAACENLVDKLLDFLPERSGNILDVACGLGATTRHLRRYYEAANVVAINISTKQLLQGQKNVPDGNFFTMDAAQLAFKHESFNTIISLEAAFHFDTRRAFLEAAYKQLMPGGYLLLSDMLFPSWAVRINKRIPDANYMADITVYQNLLEEIGFQEINVLDVTEQTWKGFYRHAFRWRTTKWREGAISLSLYLSMVSRTFLANLAVTGYLLVAASK